MKKENEFLLFCLCDLDSKSFAKPVLFDTLEVARRYLIQFIDSNHLEKFQDRFYLKYVGIFNAFEGSINGEVIKELLIKYDTSSEDILKLQELI